MNKIKKMATSQDVASLAGVSQSAVSRCFTKGASISSRTKLRVIEAAKKLGYKIKLLSISEIKNKKLVINEYESKWVKFIFERFIFR
mgnify:CR=1 FL=1